MVAPAHAFEKIDFLQKTQPKGRFGLHWLATTLLAALGLAMFWRLTPELQDRPGYLLLLLGGFGIFTWRAYTLGERFAKSDKPVHLLNYVIALTFVKMAFSLALLFGYVYWTKPAGISFVWPFFWTYVCYSVLETLALIRLSFASSPGRRDA